MGLSRRRVACGVGSLGLAVAAIGSPLPLRGQPRPRVVVIGGGAGGATCARYLAKDGKGELAPSSPRSSESARRYSDPAFYSEPLHTSPARRRSRIRSTHGYGGLQVAGVELVPTRATAVDPNARTVQLANGQSLAYDRLVVTPGIDLRYRSIDGYREAAAEIMPHGWKAGAQTALLRSQLEAMPDGGVFVIAAPPEPYRCPPAPYERASLVASYFTQSKRRSKILILDAKDSFSKQALFEEAWAKHYQGMIEWVPGALGGQVVAVDVAAMTVTTAGGDVHKADVANIVPAQEAGRIAHQAMLMADSGL